VHPGIGLDAPVAQLERPGKGLGYLPVVSDHNEGHTVAIDLMD
jgi:hypothetical protein